MPDTSGAVSLDALPADQQEAVLKMADASDATPEKHPVHTAFVVFTDREGDTHVATIDLAESIVLDKEPTEDMIFGALSVASKDMVTASTARATVEFQMQQAHAMAERAQAAAIASGLDLSQMRA